MNEIIPLSILLNSVKNIIEDISNGSLWIKAEISNVKMHNISKHYYLELVERDPLGKAIAKINGNCWRGVADKIMPIIEKKTGSAIKNGMKCDFKVNINYDILYGFSVNILDIVPTVTLGEHEKKKQQIRDKVKLLGIDQNQIKLSQPKILTSIAILAPASAAGFGDFISEAKKWNQAGYISMKSYKAIFEGSQTEGSISQAIKELNADNQKHREKTGFDLYDLVIILRGGGSKSSLAHLDEFNIIKEILELTVPVWSAIGHEEDSVLIDEYASRVFHTPSKSAGAIWDIIKREHEEYLYLMDKISYSAKHKIQKVNKDIETIHERIKLKSENKIKNALINIKHIQERLRLKDPFLILKSGYNVIYNQDGLLIKNEEELVKANNLLLKTHYGNYEISIIKKENKNGN